MPLRMANPVWIAVALVVHLPHRLPSHHPSNLLEHSGSGDGGALTAEWTGMDRNGPEGVGKCKLIGGPEGGVSAPANSIQG